MSYAQASNHRDYGATSTSSSSILPNVQFSGFSPTEFLSLSEDIAHNITAVNSSCKLLEKILKGIGTLSDQKSISERVHNIQTKANSRIEVTSIDLQRLTALVPRADKQQKLQLEKLTNDFRSIIKRYSEIQQNVAIAMKKVYSQSTILELEEHEETERTELLHQKQLIQDGIQFEKDLLLDRERQIKQIETDILDVNAIMHTVSHLLQAQGDNVERIENSIEDAAADVEQGRIELAKASDQRRSYRRKVLSLLVFAVIIGLIVTSIIVAKLTN